MPMYLNFAHIPFKLCSRLETYWYISHLLSCRCQKKRETKWKLEPLQALKMTRKILLHYWKKVSWPVYHRGKLFTPSWDLIKYLKSYKDHPSICMNQHPFCSLAYTIKQPEFYLQLPSSSVRDNNQKKYEVLQRKWA